MSNSSKRKMTEKDKKYCRCLAHVANSDRAQDGLTNIYAVCHASVKPAGNPKCDDYYAEEYHDNEEEMEALAKIKGFTYDEFMEKLGV